MGKINYGFVIVDKDNIPRHDFSVSHDPDYAKQVADTCNISANTKPDARAPYRAVELFFEGGKEGAHNDNNKLRSNH